MKITDLALVFIAIMLPIIIIVYVNVSFVTKAEKEEMYYKNLMNAAITDGVAAMKQVENADIDIDYGYSGLVDKKVSVNAEAAISAFYNSLFNNFNIAGNKISEDKFKNYIPAVAVIDYNGVYIYSAEIVKDAAGKATTVWTLKPKKYFTTKYCIIDNGEGTSPRYVIKNLDQVKDTEKKVDGRIYEITLSMDDYVVLNVFKLNTSNNISGNPQKYTFYLDDENNNGELVQTGAEETSEEDAQVKAKKQDIINYIKGVKSTVIANIVSNEITYAINAHNTIAKAAGISYNFYSPYAIEANKDEIYDNVNGIGMIAFIQGITLGNRKLNYKAYSISDLSLTKKYYLSVPIGDNRSPGPVSYESKRLYHGSIKCPVYQRYLAAHPNETERYQPSFLYKREEAATLGFYACPVCKP